LTGRADYEKAKSNCYDDAYRLKIMFYIWGLLALLGLIVIATDIFLFVFSF